MLETSTSFAEMAPDHNQKRQCLIKAAISLFAEKGFEGTSTRDISERAKVNVSMIRYYFKSKEGIYRAALLDFAGEIRLGVDQFFAEVSSKPLTRETFKEAIRALVVQIVESHLRHREMKIILFRELASGMIYSKDLHDDVFYKIIEKLSDFVKLAQAQNIVRAKVHPTAYLLMLVHTVDCFLMASRSQTMCTQNVFCIDTEKAQFIDHIADVLLEGALIK